MWESQLVQGRNNTPYQFDVYRMGYDWYEFNGVGAVYIVVRAYKKAGELKKKTLYIGYTKDMAERHGDPDNHYKANCFRKHGATHILVHEERDSDKRKEIKQNILYRNWPCYEEPSF